MESHRDGFKTGEIVEILWHEYGMARTIGMIEGIIRIRERRKRKGNPTQ